MIFQHSQYNSLQWDESLLIHLIILELEDTETIYITEWR